MIKITIGKKLKMMALTGGLAVVALTGAAQQGVNTRWGQIGNASPCTVANGMLLNLSATAPVIPAWPATGMGFFADVCGANASVTNPVTFFLT